MQSSNSTVIAQRWTCGWGGWGLTESLTLYYQPLYLTSFIFIVLLFFLFVFWC